MTLHDRLVLIQRKQCDVVSIEVFARFYVCEACQDTVWVAFPVGGISLHPIMHCGRCWHTGQRKVRLSWVSEPGEKK